MSILAFVLNITSFASLIKARTPARKNSFAGKRGGFFKQGVTDGKEGRADEAVPRTAFSSGANLTQEQVYEAPPSGHGYTGCTPAWGISSFLHLFFSFVQTSLYFQPPARIAHLICRRYCEADYSFSGGRRRARVYDGASPSTSLARVGLLGGDCLHGLRNLRIALLFLVRIRRGQP